MQKYRGTCRRPELFAKITEDSFFVHAHVCKEICFKKENKFRIFMSILILKSLKRKVGDVFVSKNRTLQHTVA
jgi:hypothetical protein